MKVRTYELSLDGLRDATVRIRRLYAIASSAYLDATILHQHLNTAIRFAMDELVKLDDSDEQVGQVVGTMGYRMSLEKQCRDLKESLRGADGQRYRLEVGCDLAISAVSDLVPFENLAAAAWTMRGWLQDFDRDLCDDLDLTGPGDARRTPKPWAFDGHVIKLAEGCYHGDWEARWILADALDDAGCPPAWGGHLRNAARHWKGCWVVDNALGRR